MTKHAGRNASRLHKPRRRLKPSREIQQVGAFDQFQAALAHFAAALAGVAEAMQAMISRCIGVVGAIDQDRAALRERLLAEEFGDG